MRNRSHSCCTWAISRAVAIPATIRSISGASGCSPPSTTRSCSLRETTTGPTAIARAAVDTIRWSGCATCAHCSTMPNPRLQSSANRSGRTAPADEEHRNRTAANLYWLRESFSLARERGLFGLVIAMHADMHLEWSPARQARSGFADLVQALREEAIAFARPVLLIHGDSHTLRFDHPLRDIEKGAPIENFTR